MHPHKAQKARKSAKCIKCLVHLALCSLAMRCLAGRRDMAARTANEMLGLLRQALVEVSGNLGGIVRGQDVGAEVLVHDEDGHVG